MSRFKLSRMVLAGGNWIRIDPIISNSHLEPEGAVIRWIDTQPQTNRHLYWKHNINIQERKRRVFLPSPSVRPPFLAFILFYLLLLFFKRLLWLWSASSRQSSRSDDSCAHWTRHPAARAPARWRCCASARPRSAAARGVPVADVTAALTRISCFGTRQLSQND